MATAPVTPIVSLAGVKARPPSLQDNIGDLDRLRSAVAAHCGEEPYVGFQDITYLARLFRVCGFRGTALVNDMGGWRKLVDFLEASPEVLAAMALDLGTTHLEASLLNLLNGSVLGRATVANRQIDYGEDILTRIHFAAEDNGLDLLREAVQESIRELATDLSSQAGLRKKDIRALAVSGNTTMTHLLLGLDPYYLCREPYIPLVNRPDICEAAEPGFDINAGAPVWFMPSVGSYFGGDLVSGILSSGLAGREEVSMLIDVGTNAEVVLGNRDWLIACAGAAGPALEGGIASMGMRAGTGAIERVKIDPDTLTVDYQTVDNTRPMGICGSGIIDLAANLYLSGLIDIRGKFREDRLPERFTETSQGPAFIVAGEEETGGEPVIFGQVDMDAMMRSKAAMYSILTTLLDQVGLDFEDLDRIYVAGSFGRHIDPRQAIILGMLPDLDPDVFEPLGNSSLAGAEAVLLDRECRDRSYEITRKITYLELNVNQDFMIRFSGSRVIPHTDTSLFPSVPVMKD
ncbi:MAG: ASKHA domain-containing protein [Desulfurivibrionaceae bacterium]